jgi:hypothetical protein
MSPAVCFTQYTLEDRAMYIACVTIFVYLVVRGVWKALDKKFGFGKDKCRCPRCFGGA